LILWVTGRVQRRLRKNRGRRQKTKVNGTEERKTRNGGCALHDKGTFPELLRDRSREKFI